MSALGRLAAFVRGLREDAVLSEAQAARLAELQDGRTESVHIELRALFAFFTCVAMLGALTMFAWLFDLRRLQGASL